ncbi:hypothetical protein ACIOZM_09830 [Pseudomonas sp. NPDC087346]|uniref:hypothetical protein n=1 Tax=Pseudomonas sp. NPDC087346 TaxID=3364438 RepID=UPI003808DA97
MTALINKIITVLELENGVVFERFVRWDGVRTCFEDIKKYILCSGKYEVIKRRQYLVLDNGAEVEIPVHEVLNLLPDRTGVLVVFAEEPSKFNCPEFPWFFNFPNNAAIYNADGSLRFQLQSSHGEGSYIGAVHYAAMPNNPDALGVLVGSVGHDPEWLYLVGPNSLKLIPTGKWVRY